MNSPIEELSARLKITEAALLRAETAMCDVTNPLDAIVNLAFLTRHTSEDPAKVREYMELTEGQARRLFEIATRALQHHKTPIQEFCG
jgi:hypothetical protein